MKLQLVIARFIDRIPQSRFQWIFSLGYTLGIVLVVGSVVALTLGFALDTSLPGLKVEVIRSLEHPHPGDTVTYTFYLRAEEAARLSHFRYELPAGRFVAGSRRMLTGELISAGTWIYADSNVLELRQLQLESPEDPFSRGLLSFSLKVAIPEVMEVVDQTYEGNISYAKGNTASSVANGISGGDRIRPVVRPFSLESKQIAGKVAAGDTAYYEVRIRNPRQGGSGAFTAKTGLVQFQDIFSSSYARILPESVRVRSRRGFSSPQAVQNTLYVDDLELLPGDEVVLTYAVRFDRKLPAREVIHNQPVAFVDGTSISALAPAESDPSWEDEGLMAVR